MPFSFGNIVRNTLSPLERNGVNVTFSFFVFRSIKHWPYRFFPFTVPSSIYLTMSLMDNVSILKWNQCLFTRTERIYI